jgi:hypothetical protein
MAWCHRSRKAFVTCRAKPSGLRLAQPRGLGVVAVDVEPGGLRPGAEFSAGSDGQPNDCDMVERGLLNFWRGHGTPFCERIGLCQQTVTDALVGGLGNGPAM